jgi:hypothetical protein
MGHWQLTARRQRPAAAAAIFAVAAAVAFVIARPPVGDLWAARARASAAAHGVGLTYWFSWFGGTVPGHYSVVAPYLLRFIDAASLGALSTVVITPLCHRLLLGSRHAVLGTWLAAIGSAFSLWSGRVPFALGSALMLVALLAVRAERRCAAAIAGGLAALVSPVSGAFLVLGLTGVLLHDSRHRASAAAASIAAGVCLVAVAGYFGTPGPEGFQPLQATVAGAAIALMLITRPPPYIRTVLVASLAACPVLALVPNGMGSNFERFAWICLPVAVAATSGVRSLLTAICAGLAVLVGVIGSIHDLVVAAQPMSNIAYYDNLIAELDQINGLANFRVEVVPDGTHVAAYALLDHAQLARGYETQSDNALNRVLTSPTLNAVTYKTWLDENAVGYVAIDNTTLKNSSEDQLVRSGTDPYLHEIWSDQHWRLFAVSTPTPIVSPPARVIDADQSELQISTPQAGSLELRVRWSRFLHVIGPHRTGQLTPDGQGWTTLVAPRAGRYTISS